MVRKTGKSSLSSKVGSAGRKAMDGHRGDDTTLTGGADLPEGIEGGIAQLTECKFDLFKTGDNKGEYYFLASGIVLEPKEVRGIPIEGLRTQIGPEALCDTPNRRRESVDDHLAWILNELRKLGVDTQKVEFDDLENVAEALKESSPYFRFRTWKGTPTDDFPTPRVNHDWRGPAKGYVPELGEPVDDQTGEEQEAEPVDTAEVAESETEPETADTSALDLSALAELADAEDADAAAKLAELASNQGINHEQYGTWAEVAALLEEATEGEDQDEEEEEETEDAWEPQKEELCQYKPPRARRQIECEVTAVFTGKQTVNLKSLDDGKVFKSVGWDRLAES